MPTSPIVGRGVHACVRAGAGVVLIGTDDGKLFTDGTGGTPAHTARNRPESVAAGVPPAGVAGPNGNGWATNLPPGLVGTGAFEFALSVPLVLEYEDAAKRLGADTALSHAEIDDVLDYLVASSRRQEIHFLWRPTLRDPADDMVLELAVAAGADRIVTFNTRDFAGSESFGVRAVTPRVLLDELEGRS